MDGFGSIGRQIVVVQASIPAAEWSIQQLPCFRGDDDDDDDDDTRMSLCP